TLLNSRDVSDVLWPTSIPNVASEYVEHMTYQPVLRTPGSTGSLNIFSTDPARCLLEQQFLTEGIKIKQQCPNLSEKNRHLGFMLLETLGLGTLIVTFRNCPNNAPLTLWVNNPWYPLFPRKTNPQTMFNRMMEAFRR